MQTQAAIEEFILKELMVGDTRAKLELDDPLISSGILDSMGLLRLIAFLEQQIGLTIDDGEVVPENFESLRAIHAFLAKKAV